MVILDNELTDNAAKFISDHMQQFAYYQDLNASLQRYIHSVDRRLTVSGISKSLTSYIEFMLTTHWATVSLRRPDVH
ncbi:hypothetical protein TNCT_566381 [Trichonephila clavata]|uniref:Uncharacterized protein n=1 Tax=Trichonephila clavata TaxID=2740835 RepID=A0A8X6FFP1_TRICU|nr:hypothetical protein TNCT_566381 [Trichonephila clavata]